MRTVMIAVTACLVSVMAAGQSAPPNQLEFRDAYLEERGKVMFQPSDAFDWRRQAYNNFHLFDIDNPDLALINEQACRPDLTASFDYDAPPTPELRVRFYYLVTESGIAELQPNKLVGRVSYSTSELCAIRLGRSRGIQTKPLAPTFDGWIVEESRTEQPHKRGVVVITDRHRKFELKPLPLGETVGGRRMEVLRNQSTGDIKVSYTEDRGSSTPLRSDGRSAPGKSFLLRVSHEEDPYLLVFWSDREVVGLDRSCTWYSLYRTGARFSELLNTYTSKCLPL